MKKIIGLSVAIVIVFIASLNSCQTVKSGHKGVEVSWGGKTNLDMVYPEGMSIGLHWVWDDMIEYDVREKTMVQKFEFNDKNNMVTSVELSLDYNLDPNKINILHTQITDIETKIIKTLKSAGKEVVPQYSAVELNITKREDAENKLNEILSRELSEFYVVSARVQMTDVDIPAKVAELAEQTAVQIGRNELALKKEAEQTALAKAKVAEAQGNYDAGILNAKTKDLLSQPKMIELQKVENERIMWEGFRQHGKSPYGDNNMFGVETSIVKGLR